MNAEMRCLDKGLETIFPSLDCKQFYTISCCCWSGVRLSLETMDLCAIIQLGVELQPLLHY